MNAWLLLAVVAATAASPPKPPAAARVRVRVHQPIPRQLLIADHYTVEAAAERAHRDRDALIAGPGQIGQPAR